ncbi:hypothetical protein BGHDH14_bgh03768 [Blumeria hordei DH14]|uniref:DNA mismatch repair protein HSM3 N-terminal domain-containing protein n=1 Tax=Blumeria graminis f. sp. hordei (strain DH14) TaxID=546991 RepID=N1JGI1_BLUG1|nr:hypothetical protein BGHDH14_bgh03768 [Blumeria hordei DH14]
MATLGISGLERLKDHLLQLSENPEIPLDESLFDEAVSSTQLLIAPDENIKPVIRQLLPPLTKILPTYQRDPSILVSLTTKLLQPLQFTETLIAASEHDICHALQSTYPSSAILGIMIISKAAHSPSYTTILSNMKSPLTTFFYTWLSTPHVSVGEAATKALGDLLETDCDGTNKPSELNHEGGNATVMRKKPPGQGLLWRRLFYDFDIYSLFFSLCGPAHVETLGQPGLDPRQRSLAQSRLLQLLPRLAMLDLYTLIHSPFPVTVDKQDTPLPALLPFAAEQMVDKSDTLMHMTLVHFYEDLLILMSRYILPPSTLSYIGTLITRVAREDTLLQNCLNTITRNPETSPELLKLMNYMGYSKQD